MNDDPGAHNPDLLARRSRVIQWADDTIQIDWNSLHRLEQSLGHPFFYRFDDPTSPVVQRSLSDRSCGSECHNS